MSDNIIDLKKFSSSSLNDLDACQTNWFCKYILGLPDKSNVRAVVGTAAHTIFEVIGQLNMRKREGNTKGIRNKEAGVVQQDYDLQKIKDKCYFYHVKQNPNLEFKDEHYKLFNTVIDTGLASEYSPAKLDMITTEQYFTIPLSQFPWAYYNNSETPLKLNGLIDVIYRDEQENTVFLDYKTGKPEWSWHESREYEYKDYFVNIQLCIYYLAVRHLYPELGNPIVKIWYLQNDKIITLHFDDDNITYVEDTIKRAVKIVENMKRPSQNKCWKCTAFCNYGKNTFGDLGMPHLDIKSDGGGHITKEKGEILTVCEGLHKFLDFRDLDTVIENVTFPSERKKK